jgi:hypothetical protein
VGYPAANNEIHAPGISPRAIPPGGYHHTVD